MEAREGQRDDDKEERVDFISQSFEGPEGTSRYAPFEKKK